MEREKEKRKYHIVDFVFVVFHAFTLPLWTWGFNRSRSRKAPNPLPAANSRRPFRFPTSREICCSQASSVLGSPAAVAEGERSAFWRTQTLI